MLPEAQDMPVPVRKICVSSSVSSHIVVQLLSPPLGVRSWACCVFGASVPEAAIDEDDELEAAPYDVSLGTQIRLWLHVNPEPHTPGVEPAAHAQLGRGIATSLFAHT
ncbi:hypothetical protein GCM10022238_26010 [Gordonia hankookensis]